MERERLTNQIIEYYSNKETKPAFFRVKEDLELLNIKKEKIRNRERFRKDLLVNFQ